MNPGAVPHGDVARWPYSFQPSRVPTGYPIDCPTFTEAFFPGGVTVSDESMAKWKAERKGADASILAPSGGRARRCSRGSASVANAAELRFHPGNGRSGTESPR